MYDAKTVDRVAQVLYTQTKRRDASSWASLKKDAEREKGYALTLVGHWHALAIASLDLVAGARERIKHDRL